MLPQCLRALGHPHPRLCVGPGAVDPLGAAAHRVVDQPVEDLAAEVAHANRVGIRKGDGDAQLGLLPVTVGDELVDFAADVLARLNDEGQEFFSYTGS